MPKITSLSQTSKEYHMNGLTLDRTVKTAVGRATYLSNLSEKKLKFNSF